MCTCQTCGLSPHECRHVHHHLVMLARMLGREGMKWALRPISISSCNNPVIPVFFWIAVVGIDISIMQDGWAQDRWPNLFFFVGWKSNVKYNKLIKLWVLLVLTVVILFISFLSSHPRNHGYTMGLPEAPCRLELYTLTDLGQRAGVETLDILIQPYLHKLVVQLNDWFPSQLVGCFLCGVVKKSVASKNRFHGVRGGLFISALLQHVWLSLRL